MLVSCLYTNFTLYSHDFFFIQGILQVEWNIHSAIEWTFYMQAPFLIIVPPSYLYILFPLKVNVFPIIVMCSIFLFVASLLQKRLKVIAECQKSRKFLVNLTWKYRMWTIKQYIVSILILISNSCLQWSFLVPFQFFIVYMSMNTLELRIFCFNVGSQERKDMGGRALKYLIEFRGTNLWNFLNFVSSHLFSLICNSGAATWLAVFNLINKGGSLIISYMQLTVKVFWG